MVTLDAWDSHLDMRINDEGLSATCLHQDGFQYMWKGCRATHGIIGGAYYYEVKIINNMQVDMPDTAPKNMNIVRLGASLPLSSLFLGDSEESWGWGGTGKKSNGNRFVDFGGVFGVGDVVGVIMDADNLSISFTKNGRFMGQAYTGLSPAVKTIGLFPHILLKNMEIEVNFSREKAWFQPPANVYFIDEATSHNLVDNPIDHPRRLEEAEFIMMVGLPGCGKTYWAMKHMESNPRKNYCLLGTNTVIDQMKVAGLTRKGNYAERWQELISMATPCFNKLCEIAGQTPRHFILDQTNVFPKARSRKVQDYMRFGQRRAVVVLNDDDTLQERTEKREREEGKFVPVDAVMSMKQNFSMPNPKEGFTDIDYVEIPESDAWKIIKQYNDQGWDFKRRNGGKGNGGGNKPNKPLCKRDVSELTFDRNNFRQMMQEEGKTPQDRRAQAIERQKQDQRRERFRSRSRSPRRAQHGVLQGYPR